MKTTDVLTQDEFELRCALAASLKDRKDAIDSQMKLMKSGTMVVCESLADARRYNELKAASGEIAEEMRELAQELKDGGLPTQIWVRFKRYSDHESYKTWRIQIREASGERPFLGIEKS